MIYSVDMETNVLLKNFTTFRTGGVAQWFCRVHNIVELKEAVNFAKDKKLPFFVLGGGSNVLISDEGYAGVVIKMEMSGVSYDEKENGTVFASAGAGENWDAFVAATVRRGLVGLENLSLIPGTVGAAPVQNIGAYGREVKDTLAEVEAFDTERFKMKKFSRETCRFGYRESFFKTQAGKKYIITGVIFALQKNGMLKTDYKDVQEYFLKNRIIHPQVGDVRRAVIAIRTAKLPDVRDQGTAGSFFKNPLVSNAFAEDISRKYPDIPFYPVDAGRKKISAGWLLDRVCGLKGIEKGNVGTYKNQALVIVNHGGATTKEVIEFAESLREQVKDKTGVVLEFEVQVVK